MRLWHKPSLSFGSLLTLAVTVFFLGTAGSAAAASPSPSPSPSPIPSGCQAVSPQPGSPIELNAVNVGKVAKAVLTDTEFFDCYDAHSALASIKHVQIFFELVDAGNSGKHASLTTLARTIEAHTCTEDVVAGGITCRTTSIALGSTKKPLAGCGVLSGTYPFAPVAQASDPTALGTVALSGDIVETVSVTKQIFDCGGSIGDLYLLSETGELADANGRFAPTGLGTHYEGVICLKNPATAAIRSCSLFTPGSA
jgi:hypothetical protein